MSGLEIDIFSPDVYAQGIPHHLFDQLRHHAPVYWHAEPDGVGFWAVTKHADVLSISRDAVTFSSEKGGTQIPDLPRGDLRVSPDVLANMDPPRHAKYRALVSSAFTPSVLRRTEDFVEDLVSKTLEPLLEKRQFDFMTEFAAKLPMTIILNMVGVPHDDEAQLTRWIFSLLVPDDPSFATTPEERADVTRQFMEYAHTLAAERRRSPKEDLLSRLMAAEIDGTKLSYEEFGMFFILLLAAGTDTPTLTLGNGIQLLIENPAEHRRLLADTSLIGRAVEEILRFSPPLIHFRRTATTDTTIRGQRIAAGQKVVMWYPSANRDEEVFPRPHVFDITREPGAHVAFGYGPHFCLGHALARMQIRIALRECVRRMPRMEPRGVAERLRSNWLNGLKSFPIDAGSRS